MVLPVASIMVWENQLYKGEPVNIQVSEDANGKGLKRTMMAT
jgi:hypothetical protein